MKFLIEAGDIILFSRPCFVMDPFSCFLCLGAKAFSGSPYDHVGLVVEDPTSAELYIVEANRNGVTFLPLKDRLLRSRSHIISVRKVFGRSSSFPRELWRVAADYKNHAYNESLHHLSSAIVSSHLQHASDQELRRHADLFFRLSALEALLPPEESYSMPFLSKVLNYFKEVDKNVDHPPLQEQIEQLRRELIHLQNNIHPAENLDTMLRIRRVNCSQLVAEILIRMKVLPGGRSALHYLPADFSSFNLVCSLWPQPPFSLSPTTPINRAQARITSAPSQLIVEQQVSALPFVLAAGDRLPLSWLVPPSSENGGDSFITIQSSESMHLIDSRGRIIFILAPQKKYLVSSHQGMFFLRAAGRCAIEVPEKAHRTDPNIVHDLIVLRETEYV